MLQDLVVSAAVEDWLKVLLPHLILTGCIEAIKAVLFSGCPVVSLACKRCSRQYLYHGKYANWSQTVHLCAGCGHKWYVTL